jgi:hypothetical protein
MPSFTETPPFFRPPRAVVCEQDCRRSLQVADVRTYGLPVSFQASTKRFGSWTNALLAARHLNDSGEISETSIPPVRKVSPGTRFLVFQRDSYTCRICKDAGVKLEVDHIKPYSTGGSNHMDNLQTLCVPCNRGKGKRLQ